MIKAELCLEAVSVERDTEPGKYQLQRAELEVTECLAGRYLTLSDDTINFHEPYKVIHPRLIEAGTSIFALCCTCSVVDRVSVNH